MENQMEKIMEHRMKTCTILGFVVAPSGSNCMKIPTLGPSVCKRYLHGSLGGLGLVSRFA